MIIHKLTTAHDAGYGERETWLKAQWERNLASQDVEWPERAAVKRAQLVGLSFFLGQPVDKDSLGEFVRRIAGGALDTQVRHLRTIGWNVIGSGRGEPRNNRLPSGERLPRGTYALLSVTTPASDFVESLRIKRSGRPAIHNWEELCRFYKSKCAHCGRNVRNPDKGHMDPNGSMELQNLIPLCPDCNNWAMNDVMFSATGRVRAVLSERLIKEGPREAWVRIAAWLRQALDT